MTRRPSLPEDAHRGAVTVAPMRADEAVADREMAAAERAVATGTADDEQRTRLLACAQYRTHEERRQCWMDSAREPS